MFNSGGTKGEMGHGQGSGANTPKVKKKVEDKTEKKRSKLKRIEKKMLSINQVQNPFSAPGVFAGGNLTLAQVTNNTRIRTNCVAPEADPFAYGSSRWAELMNPKKKV